MSREKCLYIKIYEDIKLKIERGYYKKDEKLNSIRMLCNEYNVSKNTVMKALEELELEGFIRAVEKSGFYVEHTEHLYPKKIRTNARHRRSYTDKTEFDLDFSHNGVASERLPVATMQKLYREVLSDGDVNFVSHSEPQGKAELRYAIATHLKTYRNMAADENCIVISAGMEYLYQILFQLISKKSIFGIESPGYDVLPSMLEMNGFAYLSVPVDENGVNVDFLNHTNVDVQILTPSHQFPTGCILNISRRKELIEWAGGSDSRYLIEDDYDTEFKYRGKLIPTLFEMDSSHRTIYMSSFSKTITPAIRVSYMILPKSLMKVYERTLPFISCPVSGIQQEFLTRFLNEKYYQRHVNRMKHYYRKLSEKLKRELERYEVVERVYSTDIGLHTVVSFDISEEEGEMVERLRSNRILVWGMKSFDRYGYYNKPTLLLGFGGLNYETLEDDVKKLISVIEKAD